MEFKILSHAGLAVSSGGVSLVFDPWLVGSCYWRSWWNYPPVSGDLIKGLKPDFIYLSHIHWDHFHGPTLRKFSPDTPVIVPRGHADKMKRDLDYIGFRNVVELRHGQGFDLAPGFRLTSYQFFPYLDSAIVVECEGKTLLNANDAKFMAGPLRQILRRHPSIDFVFRSHSSANGRMCFEVVDDPTVVVDDESTYIASFAAFVRRTNARYAIPFASNHCFLHKDVYPLNGTIKTPQMVEEYFNSHGISRPEVKVMVTGDAWSSESGFCIAPQGRGFFDERESHLEAYRERMTPVLEKFYEDETCARVSLAEVEAYFRKFRAAMPLGTRWYFRGYPIVFVLEAGESRTIFEVDLFRGSVRELPVADGTEPLEIHTSTFIFKQAMEVNLFALIPISKRVRFRVTRRTKSRMEFLNQLWCLYEYEVPPSGKLTFRFFETWLLRWREVFLYLRIAKDIALRRKISEQKYIES